MAGAGQLGLGQGLERLFGQPQVLAGGDFQIDRRAGHDRHRMADPLDQLGVVGGLEIAALGVGLEQQLPAKDLRRLGLPQSVRETVSSIVWSAPTRLSVPATGMAKIAAPVFSAASKIFGDPFVGQAGPRRVVDADVSMSGFTLARALATDRPARRPLRPRRCPGSRCWRRT